MYVCSGLAEYGLADWQIIHTSGLGDSGLETLDSGFAESGLGNPRGTTKIFLG